MRLAPGHRERRARGRIHAGQGGPDIVSNALPGLMEIGCDPIGGDSRPDEIAEDAHDAAADRRILDPQERVGGVDGPRVEDAQEDEDERP